METKSKYELIKYDDDETYAFRLTEGKFKDVVYKYNRFGIIEPKENDEVLNYKFEYDILEIPEEIRGKQYSDDEGKEFEELIGDILIKVIEENIEFKEEDDGKTRRYNFKEPNLF
jgi:hypothetical protein